MKKMNNHATAALMLSAIVLVLSMTSCSKGSAGATGPAGATGAAGPKGDTGVANVIYSDWLSVSFAQGVDSYGDTLYQGTITAPKITQAILTSGEVKVYVNFNTAASPDISPLPYSDYYGAVIVPDYAVGLITMTSNIPAGTYTQSGSTYLQYRYILIPGGVHARSAINWNDYSQVKAYLGLKD